MKATSIDFSWGAKKNSIRVREKTENARKGGRNDERKRCKKNLLEAHLERTAKREQIRLLILLINKLRSLHRHFFRRLK